MIEIFQISRSQKQSAWRRCPINRDKCGAKLYWLRSPNELGNLQMSVQKWEIKMKLPNFSATFYRLTTFLHGLKGVHSSNHRGQVLSLGSMNLSPMIPGPNSHPRHYLFPLFVNIIWLYWWACSLMPFQSSQWSAWWSCVCQSTNWIFLTPSCGVSGQNPFEWIFKDVLPITPRYCEFYSISHLCPSTKKHP